MAHTTKADVALVLAEMNFLLGSPRGGPKELQSPAQIAPYLLLGCRKEAVDKAVLQGRGVTHVLNCAASVVEGGSVDYAALGIVYMEFDARDDVNYDMAQHFNDTHNFITAAHNANGRVLVHCHQGINRSAAVVVHHMMNLGDKRWDVLSAVTHLHGLRSFVLTNLEFRAQLAALATHHAHLPSNWPQCSAVAKYKHLVDKARAEARGTPQQKTAAAVLEVLAKAHADGIGGGSMSIPMASRASLKAAWERFQMAVDLGAFANAAIEMHSSALNGDRICVVVSDFQAMEGVRRVCEETLALSIGFDGKFTPDILSMLCVGGNKLVDVPSSVCCVYATPMDEAKGKSWLEAAKRRALRSKGARARS